MARSAIALAVVAACTSDVRVGSERRQFLEGGAFGDGASEASTDCEIHCLDKVYACGDCVDNDGDGAIDMDDPDCFGPCHNAEDTFYGSIPGQNNAPCNQDCYFDHDTGSGNDACQWTHECDSRSPEGDRCPYDPGFVYLQQSCDDMQAAQTDECRNVCGPLVPNGCDCFGCCEIPGAPTPVWLGSVDNLFNGTCSLANVADPTLCRPCTLVGSCFNPCDTCELCIGKREIPSSCPAQSDFCPAPICPSDLQPCGVDCLPNCPSGQSCITGCCVWAPR